LMSDMERMNIRVGKPVGFLLHKPTHTQIDVHTPISKWHRFFAESLAWVRIRRLY
jgi:hypothetical protein